MHTRIPAAAALAALFGASSGADVPFSFDDIDFWVGEGTNRAAVVIDWGRDDHSAVRAWGYRWNGDATAADALLAIDKADPKLEMDASDSQYGLNVQGFTYDTYDAATETYTEGTLSIGTYWSLSSADAGGAMAESFVGASQLALSPGGRVGLKWTWYSWDSATSAYDGGDMSVAESAAVAASAPPFTFADIHYWVGEGTNRAALVVDFSAEGYAPRAWGFRWNGDATNITELVAAVAHEDQRLAFYADPYSADTFAAAFSYDIADVAAAFDLESATTTDPEAWFTVPRTVTEGSVSRGEFWNIVKGSGAAFTDVAAWTDTTGMDSEILADETWYLFRINWYTWDSTTWQYEEGSPELHRPHPAESPYGWRVADSVLNPVDGYSRANAVLGRPTVDAPASSWNGVVYPPAPIHPGAPAIRPVDIVALTSPDEDAGILGSITVEFDHPVVDDPRNPFGIDFIVFGNALQTLDGQTGIRGTDDPASIVFKTDLISGEGAIVSVSQDGENWFSFTNGPCADDFAPTLGRLYDPTSPDPALFAGTDYTNQYWGRPAHATIPVDPNVSASAFKNRSLAEYATLYNGSAGGTGFDIGALELSLDTAGRKWIRFVKVEAPEAVEGHDAAPEIDAIADVSPAPSFRNWVDTHVAFADRPGYAKTTVCANGLPAYVNAALGLAPDTPSDGAFAVTSFAVEDDAPVLRAPLAPYAYDLVRLRWSDSLETPAAQWQTALPLWHAEGANQSHAEGAESAEFSSRVLSSAPVLSRPAQARPAPALYVPAAAAPDGAAFYRIELHD